MAAIVNDRDVLLQAASPRVLPVPIPEEIKEQLRRLKINASATTVTEDGATTTPATITLTAVKEGTLAGAVTWAAAGATVTGSGDTVSVAGTSIVDAGATVTASVTQDGKTYSAQINLTKTKVPKGLRVESNGVTFIGRSSPTTPSAITLTAVRSGGLTGTVSWSVFAGSATLTPSGDTCTVTGSTVAGYSVTIKATVGTYSATIALTRLGELSAQQTVDLTNQVTGALNAGNVTGLGALALLNTVNLNTQTTGALNGATQVTNLGTLAYANAIAANQIGAGQLAAGVVYAGTINADKINGGSFAGKTFSGGTFTGGMYSGSNFTGGSFVGTSVEVTSVNASSNIGAPNVGVGTSFTMGTTTWLVPPTSGASNKYMRADGQWATPSTGGSSGVTSFNSRTGAVSLNSTDVNNAVSGQTLGVNVTGTSGDSSKLAGYAANYYLRVAGTTVGGSRPFVAYLPVTAGGSTYYIPLYS